MLWTSCVIRSARTIETREQFPEIGVSFLLVTKILAMLGSMLGSMLVSELPNVKGCRETSENLTNMLGLYGSFWCAQWEHWMVILCGLWLTVQ